MRPDANSCDRTPPTILRRKMMLSSIRVLRRGSSQRPVSRRKIGQLVIMGGEQRLRPDCRWVARYSATPHAMLGRRTVDVRATISSSTTANATWRCAGCGRLLQFDHERRVAAGDVCGAPTRARCGRPRHLRSRAGTNERPAPSRRRARLPKIGRLAAHVRPGQDDELARRAVQRDVVRHERIAGH